MTASDDRAPRWLLGGLTLGAAAIVRPTALVLAAAFVIVLV